MKYTLLKNIMLSSLLLFSFAFAQAQDGSAKASEKEKEEAKIRFNGLGRTTLSQTSIDGRITDTDSSTIESLTDGEFLLDLAINATPNKTSEVQAIIRLRNEFGGFFGSGIAVEVREIWGRGIIADFLKYRIGDMDLAMSPYTLYSTVEDGSVNEAAIFRPQKEVIHYEQFYTDDNTRRLQGAKLDFGLDFSRGLRDMEASAFITRIRGTDFFTVPTRLVSGGQLDFTTATFDDSLGLKADFGLNVVQTFDDLQSGNANEGIRNRVITLDFDVSIMDKENLGLHLLGETGQSTLAEAQRITNANGDKENTILTEEDDTFLDIGVMAHFKPQNLKVSVSFIDIGPDFFSMGAQSKRIDYGAQKSFYNRIGLERDIRMPALFDIGRDRALYTFAVRDRLMDYDPRYNNTLPYGNATANRQGLKFGLEYGQIGDTFNATVDGALLTELRGQGTQELKSFTLLRAAANLNIHQLSSWKNKLRLTLGAQIESTSRAGVEIEQIDLNSNLIEVGLEWELFPKFDLLLGTKLLSAQGSEYIPLITRFNDVVDFPGRFTADDTETLLGAGIKYQFKKDIYLTLQYQNFSSQMGADNPNDYELNQVFVLYNMNF